MTNQELFNYIQKTYRTKFLKNLQQMDKDFDTIADQFNSKIARIVRKYGADDSRFKAKDLPDIKRELDAIVYWFEGELKNFLDAGIEEAAKIATEGQDTASKAFIMSMISKYKGNERELLKKVLGDKDTPFLLSCSYGEGLPKYIRDKVWNYRWPDGFRLSDRIWVHKEGMRKVLHQTIEECVNKGYSAVEFSHAVEEYMKKSGVTYTTKIKPSLKKGDVIKIFGKYDYVLKKDLGSVKYNALRLARTETNGAYWMAQQLGDQESIIIKGTKRNLSASHPTYPVRYRYKGYQEICDYYALANHSGLGTGVFKAGQAERDHPNGLCYLTSVLLSVEELLSVLSRKYNI